MSKGKGKGKKCPTMVVSYGLGRERMYAVTALRNVRAALRAKSPCPFTQPGCVEGILSGFPELDWKALHRVLDGEVEEADWPLATLHASGEGEVRVEWHFPERWGVERIAGFRGYGDLLIAEQLGKAYGLRLRRG